MTGARLVPYRRLRRVAESAGYSWICREGSHNVFRNADGQIVVIPDHGSRPIGCGLLSKILKQMGLTVEEYHRLLDR